MSDIETIVKQAEEAMYAEVENPPEVEPEPEKIVIKAIKTWDYCGMRPRFFCYCKPFDPPELSDRDGACPVCGSKHTEFIDAGF